MKPLDIDQLNARFDDLTILLSSKFESIDRQFERIDRRFERLEKRLTHKIDELDTRLSSQLAEVDARLSNQIDHVIGIVSDLQVRHQDYETELAIQAHQLESHHH